MSEQQTADWFYWREAESGERLGRSSKRAFAEGVAFELASAPNGDKPARAMEVVDEAGTVLVSFPVRA